MRRCPSRRHSSAMVSSPRNPSSTTRIFSSAEKCRRVARRMSLIASSAGYQKSSLGENRALSQRR